MELSCVRCKQVKPDTEFYNSTRNKARGNKSSYCIPCNKEKNKENVLKNYERVRKYRNEYTRHKRAFFPPGLFEERFAEQGNACAICGSKESGGKGQFHADHDHEAQSPRGILCFHCNSALGFFKDNVESLKAAIKYLEQYQKPRSS